MKSSKVVHIFLIALLSISCTSNENVTPKPAISIQEDVINNWNGHITGKTIGVNPSLYYLAAYGKINDLWHNLPDNSTPVIPISDENKWVCHLDTVEFDQVSEINIYLLPIKFNPPILNGERSIPIKLNLLSVAKYNIKRKSESGS